MRNAQGRTARLLGCWRGGNPDDGPSPRAGWFIRFRFDQEVIDELKRTVPARDRGWFESQAAWWVDEQWTPELRRLFPNISVYVDAAMLPGLE